MLVLDIKRDLAQRHYVLPTMIKITLDDKQFVDEARDSIVSWFFVLSSSCNSMVGGVGVNN